MPTTSDIEDVLIHHGFPKGEARWAIRIAQQAQIFPKSKPGAWRNMEQLTFEQVADFLMMLAGTRGSGKRDNIAAKEAVESFNSVFRYVQGDGDKPAKISLKPDLVTMMQKLSDTDAGMVQWVLFVNDPICPAVETRCFADNGVETALNYAADDEFNYSAYSDAFLIRGELLIDLGGLFRDNEKQTETEEAGAE